MIPHVNFRFIVVLVGLLLSIGFVNTQTTTTCPTKCPYNNNTADENVNKLCANCGNPTEPGYQCHGVDSSDIGSTAISEASYSRQYTMIGLTSALLIIFLVGAYLVKKFLKRDTEDLEVWDGPQCSKSENKFAWICKKVGILSIRKKRRHLKAFFFVSHPAFSVCYNEGTNRFSFFAPEGFWQLGPPDCERKSQVAEIVL